MNSRAGRSDNGGTPATNNQDRDPKDVFAGMIYIGDKDKNTEYLTLYMNDKAGNRGQAVRLLSKVKTKDYAPDFISENGAIKAHYKTSQKGNQYLNIKFYNNNKFLYSYKGILSRKKLENPVANEKKPDYIIFCDSIFTAEDMARLYPDKKENKGQAEPQAETVQYQQPQQNVSQPVADEYDDDDSDDVPF